MQMMSFCLYPYCWTVTNDIVNLFVSAPPLCTRQATNPYLTAMPQVGSTFSPYFTPGPVMPAILGPDPTSVGSPLSVVPQTVVAQQKMARSDRLEVSVVLKLSEHASSSSSCDSASTKEEG